MSKYAVVRVGAHQYRVEENTVFDVELMDASADKDVKLDQVLFVQTGSEPQIGQPFVKNASVTCKAIGEVKQPKVISFKRKRRKQFKKHKGHRQQSLRLQVTSIQAG